MAAVTSQGLRAEPNSGIRPASTFWMVSFGCGSGTACASALSADITARPPDEVDTATPLDFKRGALAKKVVVSISASSVSTVTTPARSNMAL